MSNLRIGIDLDGVGYNFGDSVRRYMDSIGLGHLWKSGPTPTPFWNWYEDWGWSTEQFLDLCHAGADAGYIFTGPARDGFKEMIARVSRFGDIVIVTDRAFGSSPEVSEKATVEWLSEHGIWYDELIFSRDKTVGKADIFIDDKIENFEALNAAGTQCWLLTRPWNEQHDTDQRISDVTDYVEKVTDMWVERALSLPVV